MAKYANPEAGQQDDMYSDAASGGKTEEPSKPEDKEEGKSYLLPKAVLEGKEFEPGDEVVLRIVAMHDDQIEVQYAPAKEQEEEGKESHDEGGGAEPAGGMPGEGSNPMAAMYE